MVWKVDIVMVFCNSSVISRNFNTLIQLLSPITLRNHHQLCHRIINPPAQNKVISMRENRLRITLAQMVRAKIRLIMNISSDQKTKPSLYIPL